MALQYDRPISSLSMAVVAALLVIALPSVSTAGRPAGAPPPPVAVPAPIGRPGCETRCGNVSVWFPFGFGPASCSAGPGFNLTCDNTTTRPGTAPRLLLGDGGMFEVKEIFLEQQAVRVVRPPIFGDAARNISRSGATMTGSWGGGGLRDDLMQYTMEGSNMALEGYPSPNLLAVTGCNVQATLLTKTHGEATAIVGCSTHCTDDAPLNAQDVRDSGTQAGYCTATINTYRTYYDVELKRLSNATINNDVPVYVLIAEVAWFSDDVAVHLMKLEKPRPKQKDENLLQFPVFLGWDCLNDGSCNASVSANTNCSTANEEALYWCVCEAGYEGNPYVAGGCQDINECKHPENYGCFGECANKIGSFDCWCQQGFDGNANEPNGCVKTVKNLGLIIGLSVSTIPCVMLLVLGGILISRKLKHYRAKRLKLKFFNQNHGQLLQQLISQRSDIGERMIIPLMDLEKATNNFDESRKLGGGGHGTVYKGILSDLHVVAIKKSNIMVQREIDDFINEVAILSQINHRNVVKIHGCCLETEVPLLAYEFISNGTLCDHLHHASLRSIPWGDRLRISSEVGKAIAYLHFAVSIPIIHRDIKSSNILLDDALTAKVSDFGASRYIPIDEVGITATAVQGTIGYLDPMYYYTRRLSKQSDVYSFGVLLVELLTRKMPIKYRSPEGDGLVVQFVELLEQGNLVEILDSQVVEEGGCEVKEVCALAASCTKLNGEERPTMRQVEMVLEGLLASKERAPYGLRLEKNEDKYTATSYPSNKTSISLNEVSRQHRQEEEFALSARYPR